MLAKFIGGPYDGIALDHNDINLYCTFSRIGGCTFIEMPPFENWEAVRRGDVDKNTPFPKVCLFYQLVRNETGMEARFDENAEALLTAMREQEQAGSRAVPPSVEFRGTYYRCLRGDVDNLGVTAPDSFSVRDEKGRNWVCHPVAKEGAASPSLFAGIADVLEAQGRSHELGLASRGTKVEVLLCDSRDELRRKLADILD